jgi:hypothetical protein
MHVELRITREHLETWGYWVQQGWNWSHKTEVAFGTWMYPKPHNRTACPGRQGGHVRNKWKRLKERD